MAAAQNQNQICSCVYTGGGGVHVCIQVAAAQRLYLFCASVYSFQQPLKIRSVQQVALVFLVVFIYLFIFSLWFGFHHFLAQDFYRCFAQAYVNVMFFDMGF